MGYLFYQVFQFKHEATIYLGIHRSVKAHQILLEGHQPSTIMHIDLAIKGRQVVEIVKSK